MARETVYVIGAGFSAGLGYPLTHDLLLRFWPRIDGAFKDGLEKVVRFHHPGFNPARFPSFPNVEQLLSEMTVNEELFEASRQYGGQFTKDKLKSLQRDILLKVADWFHELSTAPRVENARQEWLGKFQERVADENAAIISFNWDLILDQLLFSGALGQASYGFPKPPADSPVLLKPHGSLNWFEDKPGRFIKERARFSLHSERGTAVYAFRDLTRGPSSQNGRTYLPLIIPPIYLKKFDAPVFTRLWQNCTSALSTARKVVFLGYSMPLADLHAQFIMRCGFHNQVEGELDKGGKRKPKTGSAAVTIVNPDRGAAERTAAVVGFSSNCTWISMPVADWIAGDTF